MVPLTLAAIADAVGGVLHDVPSPDVSVTGTIEFDSRKLAPGGLFLALPGARTDGHDHAAAAIAAGAVAVLAARPVGVPAIVVSPTDADRMRAAESHAMAFEHDTTGSAVAVLGALAKLARLSVDRLAGGDSGGGDSGGAGLTVIGVTGSSGKTSTKDLLAAVLAPLGPTVAPPGSFNNELGHPWTALRAGADTRFLVLELSARGPGHIAALAAIAPPRVGVVLNVGTAHLGEFGSREMIAQTKGELVEALPADGLAVLNADDPLVAAMAGRTRARVCLVGTAENADVRAVDVRLDELARPRFTLVCAAGRVDVALAVHGEHQVGNALAAAAVALECGADPGQVAAALGGAEAVSGRRMDVRTRADGVTVVNDSYNANPDSMRAALKALVTMARSSAPARRTWAVLGEMAELGADSVGEHDGIGRQVVRLAVDRLVVIGDSRPAHAMHHSAVLEGSWGGESVLVPDRAAATALLRAELMPGDLVLVKASRSEGLWSIAETLATELSTVGADAASARVDGGVH